MISKPNKPDLLNCRLYGEDILIVTRHAVVGESVYLGHAELGGRSRDCEAVYRFTAYEAMQDVLTWLGWLSAGERESAEYWVTEYEVTEANGSESEDEIQALIAYHGGAIALGVECATSRGVKP